MARKPEMFIHFPGTKGTLEFPNERGWWEMASFLWDPDKMRDVSGGGGRSSLDFTHFFFTTTKPASGLYAALLNGRTFPNVTVDLPRPNWSFYLTNCVLRDLSFRGQYARVTAGFQKLRHTAPKKVGGWTTN